MDTQGENVGRNRTWLVSVRDRMWATVSSASWKDVAIVFLSVALVIAVAITVFLARAKPETKEIPAILPEELSIPGFYPPPPLTNFTGLRGRRLYVFGDSSVDPGNYNITEFPYGMDLSNRVSGRFSNGFTIADYLALRVSTGIPKAYRSLGIDQLRTVNINFATGGCGVLERTKTPFPFQCMSLREQVKHFRDVMPTVNAEPIFFFSFGFSDFIYTFLRESSRLTLTMEDFADEMIGELLSTVETLYNDGGRTFIISNVSPLGCMPDMRQRVATTNDECDEKFNHELRFYNSLLQSAIWNFTGKVGASVILADTSMVFTQIMEAPTKYGFEDVKSPCCGYWMKGKYICNHQMVYCDRKVFLFFDGRNPTDEANRLFVQNCVSGSACRTFGPSI